MRLDIDLLSPQPSHELAVNTTEGNFVTWVWWGWGFAGVNDLFKEVSQKQSSKFNALLWAA